MKIVDEENLFEMSMSRRDAIDRCISLGEKFSEHFVKTINEGSSSQTFFHHCQEMQTWLDSARKIKLKDTNKSLSRSQLWDWFFTAGQDVEDVVGNELVDLYERFFLKLSGSTIKVVDAFKTL